MPSSALVSAMAVALCVTRTVVATSGSSRERRQRPRGDLVAGLAAAPADVAPGDPVGELVREPLADLVAGQPLPVAEPALAQPRLGAHRQPGDSPTIVGGLQRARRVRADEQVRSQRGDEAGDLVGLGAADLVQRRVGLALEAALRVPRGAAVPQQQDADAGSLRRALAPLRRWASARRR